MSARETSGAAARGRPLSPHMSIYKMSRYCLLTSIANRFAGLFLSLGLLLLLYWLVSVAGGARAYAAAAAVLSSPPLEVIYALLLLAFVYHLVAGIRHLVWDTGRGMSRAQSRRSAYCVIAVSLAVTAILVGWAYVAGAGVR
ncbi:MAG: succinate dehydrogenase, cytochrome b556 subunit [Steroidobacteraceae bacterium]